MNAILRHWRQAVIALGLAASLAGGTFGTTISANAQTKGPEAVDEPCIIGTVIDWREQLLTGGWDITATPYDSAGALDPSNAITTKSDASGAFQFGPLTPGKWQIAIALPSTDWEPVTPDKFDVEVGYGKPHCGRVRFKLRQIVIVDIVKVDDEHLPLPGWKIRATPGPGNVFALPQEAITNNDGMVTFKLTPGRWIFSESSEPGTKYVPVMPLGNIDLNVELPGPYSLRFKNRLTYFGCISVNVSDAPPLGPAYGLQDWGVKVLRTDGTVAAQGKTDALGNVVFSDLPLGPYTVVAEQRLGWQPVAPTMVSVNLADPECVPVDFVFEQDAPGYKIAVFKFDTNGLQGLPGITVTATPLTKGGYEPAPVVTNGFGRAIFDFPIDNYSVPGARYKVCEVLPAGWLNHTPICVVVTLPGKPSAPVEVRFENQQVGHWETHPAMCRVSYIIAKGDTWAKIARTYRVAVRKLTRTNPDIKARKYLTNYIGTTLCIP